MDGTGHVVLVTDIFFSDKYSVLNILFISSSKCCYVINDTVFLVFGTVYINNYSEYDDATACLVYIVIICSITISTFLQYFENCVFDEEVILLYFSVGRRNGKRWIRNIAFKHTSVCSAMLA